MRQSCIVEAESPAGLSSIAQTQIMGANGKIDADAVCASLCIRGADFCPGAAFRCGNAAAHPAHWRPRALARRQTGGLHRRDARSRQECAVQTDLCCSGVGRRAAIAHAGWHYQRTSSLVARFETDLLYIE